MRFDNRVRLADVCEIRYGKDHKKLGDGDIPAYGSGGLMRYVDSTIHNKKSVLIPRKGTLSNLFLVDPPFWTVDTLFWTDIDEEKILPEYLFYQLKTMDLASKNVGTAVPSLTTAVLNEITIALPSIKEQEKTVSPLISIDRKIEANKQINDNLQQQLLALYSELLTSHEIQQSIELRELCNFQEGYVNPPQTHPEFFDGNVKWLRAVDINESFIIETTRTLTAAGFESAKKSALLFRPNTIAISKSGTIGRLGIIADYMCGNRAVINIQPKNSQYLPLIYAFLKSKQKEFPDLAVGSVQKNLYISILEPLKVGLPETAAVENFCSTGCNMLFAMQNNCRESIALANLRDVLLPRLMSGEIDV